jgi:putative Holliday junction resolvase
MTERPFEETMMTIAALDIGLKRIGTALCLDGATVLPHTPIKRTGRKQAARDVCAFLHEWGVELLIVGLPRGGNSQEEMERRIRHFVGLLTCTETITIRFQDEADSSREAEEAMRGTIRYKRDGRIDSLAAKIILERWLRENGDAIS